MEIIKNGDTMLVAKNEFSKTFKIKDVDLYLAKAYDDETNTHFLVVSIPHISETSTTQIQYPINFATEVERDEAFVKFDISFAKTFVDDLITFMKEQQNK
jgi:hypothetical protein